MRFEKKHTLRIAIATLVLGVLTLLMWLQDGELPPTNIRIAASQYHLTNMAGVLIVKVNDDGSPTTSGHLFCGQEPAWADDGKGRREEYKQLLVASVVITNLGSSAVAVDSYGTVPQYSWTLESTNGISGEDYTYLTGAPNLLPPHGSVAFSVWLPPRTRAWWLHISCWRVSRPRAFLWEHPKLCQWWPRFVWDIFPSLKDEFEVTSPRLDVIIPEQANGSLR